MKLNKLTNEELVYLYKQTKDERVLKRIMDMNYGMVRKLVNKYVEVESLLFTYSDMDSVGNIGLWKAVESYSADSGTKFSSYLYKCISNELSKAKMTEMRRQKNPNYIKYKQVNIDSKLKMDTEVTFGEMLSYDDSNKRFDDVNDFANKEMIDTLYNKVKDKITPKQKGILDYMLQGYEMPEIAKKMGCSNQNVNTGVRRMRASLEMYRDEYYR